jgi:DNA-binding response OmpR family regulator
MMVSKQTAARKILVIEDEEFLLNAVTAKLKHEGFIVVGVKDAEEGLAELAKDGISLIWLDLLLPKMSGLDFLFKLRQNEKYVKIPVIIVSNLDDTDKIRRAFELNVVDYKVKAQTDLGQTIEEIKAYLEVNS